MVLLEIIIIMLLTAAIVSLIIKKKSYTEKIIIRENESDLMRHTYYEHQTYENPVKNLDYRETLKELGELLKYVQGIYNKNIQDMDNIKLIEEAIFEIEKQRGYPPIELIQDIEGMIENLVNFYDLKGV